MDPMHYDDEELAAALDNGEITELDLPLARRLAEALDRPEPKEDEQ